MSGPNLALIPLVGGIIVVLVLAIIAFHSIWQEKHPKKV